MFKKTLASFLALSLVTFICCTTVLADNKPKVSAKSAIVIDADSRSVIFSKNEHEKLPIASTTKIMTALLTLEAAEKENRTINITDEMVRVEGSSMGLRAGNKVTLESLAKGMLAASGNDAANSAAIAIGGSLQGFAELMNKKAKNIGMNDTHFVTPSGLDDKNHYSSAYDLAILAASAMENNDFADIVGKKIIKVNFDTPQETRIYKNHNKLLSMYDGCTGVKTGFTKKSGRCLVSSAERNGIRIIAVTLSDPCDWEDHKELLDYGFSKLQSIKINDSSFKISLPVVGSNKKEISVSGTEGEKIIVPSGNEKKIKRYIELPHFVYAPVKKGDLLGHIKYVLNGKMVSQTELLASSDANFFYIRKNFFNTIIDKIKFTLFYS